MDACIAPACDCLPTAAQLLILPTRYSFVNFYIETHVKELGVKR